MISKTALFQLAKTLDGLAVLGCMQGTPAALAGVRYGDVLLEVNGRRTRNFGEYIEAKALRADGMKVVIFRSGEERPIELEYASQRAPVDPATLLGELVTMRLGLGDPDDERMSS